MTFQKANIGIDR